MAHRIGTIARRGLLAGAGVGALGLLAACTAFRQQGASSQADGSTPTTPASSQPKVQTFDLHADTVDSLSMRSHKPYSDFVDNYTGDLMRNNGELSADRMAGMAWAQCYAIWLPDEGDISHLSFYREAVSWFKRQMETYSDTFGQARSIAEAVDIMAQGKIAAILTVENAACADEGLEVVDEFARDGVVIAGITWNGENVLGSGNDHPEKGLTELGRSYVAALENHNIVVDVSHLNDAGFWDVAEVATKPFIATHSNARAICDVPRNLSDEMFATLLKQGGLAGLNFNQGFVRKDGTLYDFDQLAAHVEHWLELGGEDAIALGSDRDGAEVPKWLADAALQPYLYERFSERLGGTIADKLFSGNVQRFFGV